MKGGDTTGFDPASTKHLFMFQKGFSDKKGTKDIYIPTKVKYLLDKINKLNISTYFFSKTIRKK